MLTWLCCASRCKKRYSIEAEDPSAHERTDDSEPLISSRQTSIRTASTDWSPLPSPSLIEDVSSISSQDQDMTLTPPVVDSTPISLASSARDLENVLKSCRPSIRPRRGHLQAPREETTCSQRLASLFNAQSLVRKLPLILFLNLEWCERLQISKTCRLYYRFWYLYDFTPRVMHDAAFGAVISVRADAMAYRCVIDMYGQGFKHGFTPVAEFAGSAAISPSMEIYGTNFIQRFRPGYMAPAKGKRLRAEQELELRFDGSTNACVTPSGCILVRALWMPARYPPEQDGIIETWGVGPGGGNLTIRDLVQVITLQNPNEQITFHPVDGFEPFKRVPHTWTGLDQRPPLPALPPGRGRITFKTEAVAFPSLRELDKMDRSRRRARKRKL